jgi:hypothetical protein
VYAYYDLSSKSIEGKETEIYLEAYRRRAADGNPHTGVLRWEGTLHSSAERERGRCIGEESGEKIEEMGERIEERGKWEEKKREERGDGI